eukprot:4686657-Ditylum_brightwellii.AAC.1
MLEFVINHIKKTVTREHDVAEALHTFIKPDLETWKPTLQISSKQGIQKHEKINNTKWCIKLNLMKL